MENYSDISKKDVTRYIGMRVMNALTHSIGVIKDIRDGIVVIDYHGDSHKYDFPAAFGNCLVLEDDEMQEELQKESVEASFNRFKKIYISAINNEIGFLKATGGKRYKIIDGERLPSKSNEYLYAFETDTDLHFPDGTAIKLWFLDKTVTAYVLSCEDFTILIRTKDYIGEFIESVDFTSDQWQLLESLVDRLNEVNPKRDTIAYEVSINGRYQITKFDGIKCGQNKALNRATSDNITFIWGPPGTGKTDTLAKIALMHIDQGRRVLMLSYSNVSVDEALMRVARQSDFEDGCIVRYGYPRKEELLESKTLTSYQYVLSKNPRKASEYQELIEKKKKLKRKDAERIEINKQLNKIKEYFLEEEKKLIQDALFVATTVSKATVDRAVYMQNFDVVIFDEASMAYVPQIVFAASLAKLYFICMGDFCQLPAIVQNRTDDRLSKDIFEFTGITEAVRNDYGHRWLVMLNTQYRMHKEISDIVSKLMYGNRLMTAENILADREGIADCVPCKGLAMALVDLSGMYSVCTQTMDKSRINILSALLSLRMAEKSLKQNEVGIITPYNAQSRLILAMIRDMQETDERWKHVSCATVHQFQGSEKSAIVYDAVDCYRMAFPGTLLTSLKNDTANRLFNVALTRAKGKFVLIANVDYLKRKRISRNLIFSKVMEELQATDRKISGSELLDEMMPTPKEKPYVYVEDRENSWIQFVADIKSAKSRIFIDIPDVIDENDSEIMQFANMLDEKETAGLDIKIRVPENIDLPECIRKYICINSYVTNPITIIDGRIIWFGQPLYAADFVSEGDILDTEFYTCARFEGKHTARSIKAFLEM